MSENQGQGDSEDSGPAFEPDLDLLERIYAHELDDPDAEMPFSERLGRENGWTPAFTYNVIKEYRRFVYLMCIAKQELTPSDEVDQVWHLHLAYSRDYWDIFCKDVLKRPLHHGPTTGGDNEDERYERNYENTLKIYRAVFDHEPPNTIWPPASIRFGWTGKMVRMNGELFTVESRGAGGTVDDLRTQAKWLHYVAMASAIATVFAVFQSDLSVDQAWLFVLIAFVTGGMGYILDRGVGAKKHALITTKDWHSQQARSVIEQPHHGYDIRYILTGDNEVAGVRTSVADFVKLHRTGRGSDQAGGWTPGFGGAGCGGYAGHSDGGGSGCGSGCSGGGGCGGGGGG